jgi:hypothetical protein
MRSRIQSRTEMRVRHSPKVKDVSDERQPGDSKNNPGDGIWAYLMPKLCNHGYNGGECVKGGCLHSVHEYTWTDVEKGLREVGPCTCGDCG